MAETTTARTFTRDEIIAALALHPCHVTGMHQPEHHLKYTCDIQRAEALARLLDLIGATEADLPHELHDAEDCGWCHRIPGQEVYRDRLRKTHRWAGVEVSPELAERGV